jgi:hypothetical protein
MYYDRAWAGNRFHLPRLLIALFVFILGYGAIAFAQFRGWAFVGTGIPVIVLSVLCIGIAFSAILQRVPAEIARRWRALRPPGRG